MKKEYKDFYRFLWEYLESGNSAIIIKPRQVGMTSFAARYAAWCVDYKDVGVKLHTCKLYNTEYIRGMISNFRCFNPYTTHKDYENSLDRILPIEGCSILDIFDEFDFMDNRRLADRLRGYSINQMLAYTTVSDLENLQTIKHSYLSRNLKRLEVFNMSDHIENTFKFKSGNK